MPAGGQVILEMGQVLSLHSILTIRMTQLWQDWKLNFLEQQPVETPDLW